MSAIVMIGGRVVGGGGYLIGVGAGAAPTLYELNFTWTPPTYTTGEVTGYQIGLRTGGSPGTYSILLPIPGGTSANVIMAQILPSLAAGTYYGAIQSIGPIDSAWSTPEVTFTVP